MSLSNFHTHTVFCDGKDEPEAMVKEALRLGCLSIGFSGHSHVPLEEDWFMSVENTEKYKKTILELREKYKGQIKIYLGIEQDVYSDMPTDDYDYVIGAVHYVQKNGRLLPVDESRESFLSVTEHFYAGDFYAFAEDYYAVVSQVYALTGCDVVAHFDLITKYNEGNALFDTGHPRYLEAADKALKALLATPVAFELNTGGMARGYRSTPYPEKRIVEEIQRAGKRILLSSDCHDRSQLLYGFELFSDGNSGIHF